jgi:hypothetical protein
MSSFAGAPPPSLKTNPALLHEMQGHLEVSGEARATIERRVLDWQSTSPFPDEIDPRDADSLEYLAKLASELEARVASKQVPTKEELQNRMLMVDDFWNAQPECVKEFRKEETTLQDFAADNERMETEEIPRLLAEYEKLRKETEGLQQRLFRISVT